MKITMFEIEANAEDLRASRSIAETMAMGIGRIADRIADAIGGYRETVEEVEPEEEEGSEE